MPTLTIQAGPQAGQTFSFDDAVVIGRGVEADLVIEHRSVSRRHARVSSAGGAWVLEDLGSANGTRLNGHRVTSATPIGAGDTLQVGSVPVAYGIPAKESAVTLDVDERPAPKEVLIRMSALSRVGPAPSDKAAATSDMTWLLRFIEDLGTISRMVFDENALLDFVVGEVLNLITNADRAFVMLKDPSQADLVPRGGRSRTGPLTTIPMSRTLLHDVLERREAIMALDLQAEANYARARSVTDFSIRSVICAPMIFENEIYGVLQVDTTRGAKAFGHAETALALSLASQLGMALACARLHAAIVEQELLSRDLQLARRIQQHFLPASRPEIPGYGFALDYRPALAVGGDFYDFIGLEGGRLALVLGDASGKGVSAALFAARVASDLRYLASGHVGPADLLVGANRTLTRGELEGMFATIAIVVLDPRAHTLVVASAGHPLPLLRSADGSVRPIGQLGDGPVGVNPDSTYQQYEQSLAPGDVVVLFSDGVTEGMNERQELFGERRLVESIGRPGRTVPEVLGAVQSDLSTFVGRAAQSDDITAMCVGRDSVAGPPGAR